LHKFEFPKLDQKDYFQEFKKNFETKIKKKHLS